MEKVKTIKIWPSAHVEIKLHIEEIGACTLLANEMLKQLEGGVMSKAEATVFIVMLIYTGFVIYILRK